MSMSDEPWPFPFPRSKGDKIEARDRASGEQQRPPSADATFAGFLGVLAGNAARRANMEPRIPELPGEPRAPLTPFGPMGSTENPTERAARATGVSREYIDALIGHESGGDDEAEAGSSSATGAAQFTDGTWLRIVRQYGEPYGFGRGHLADLDDAQILELRKNRQWSALMAAEYARENVAELRRSLPQRVISERDAYLAHFLGPADAANVLRASQEDRPLVDLGRDRRAAQVVSRAAVEANPNIFFERPNVEWRDHPRTGRRYQHYLGGGRARSAADVVAMQGQAFRREPFIEGEHSARLAREREAAERERENERAAELAERQRYSGSRFIAALYEDPALRRAKADKFD